MGDGGRALSPAQKLLSRVLPARWFADLEAETRGWEVACSDCGRARNLWDAGGMRWRATGESRVSGTCSGCGGKRAMTIRRAG